MVAPNLNSVRLLLVEDDQVLRKVTSRLINGLGYYTDSAKDGSEALLKASTNRYDFIIMDISLPGMSGIEAARQISSLPLSNDRSNAPVIIALTADRIDKDLERFHIAGFSDVLSKPLQLESLGSIIEKWAGNAGTQLQSDFGNADGNNRWANGIYESDASPVNVNRLTQMAGGELDRRRELAASFLAQMGRKLAELNKAIAVADGPEALRLAHFCAGSSATCGMTSLATTLRELECALQNNDSQLDTTLMKHCEEALNTTRLFLSELLANKDDRK